jgi:uncharacterized protein YdaU (DUF1376 family)
MRFQKRIPHEIKRERKKERKKQGRAQAGRKKRQQQQQQQQEEQQQTCCHHLELHDDQRGVWPPRSLTLSAESGGYALEVTKAERKRRYLSPHVMYTTGTRQNLPELQRKS